MKNNSSEVQLLFALNDHFTEKLSPITTHANTSFPPLPKNPYAYVLHFTFFWLLFLMFFPEGIRTHLFLFNIRLSTIRGP